MAEWQIKECGEAAKDASDVLEYGQLRNVMLPVGWLGGSCVVHTPNLKILHVWEGREGANKEAKSREG